MNYKTPTFLLGLLLSSTAATAEDLRQLTVDGFISAPFKYYYGSGYVWLPDMNTSVSAVVDWDTLNLRPATDRLVATAEHVPITYFEYGEPVYSGEGKLTLLITDGSDPIYQRDQINVIFDFPTGAFMDSHIEAYMTLPSSAISGATLETAADLLTSSSYYSGLMTANRFYATILLPATNFDTYGSLTGLSLASIPEPSTFAVLSGAAGLALAAVRRQRRR